MRSVRNHGMMEKTGNRSMQLRRATEKDMDAWDAYVRRHPESTLFHTMAWRRVIEASFSCEPRYYLVEQEGRIRGVLPLFLVKSLLAGRALISVPFSVYGGILADNEAATQLLRDMACREAEANRVDYLELRNLHPTRSDWPGKNLNVTFMKEISDDHEENMKAIPRKQRAMIRKAMKNKVQARVEDDLEGFFEIYSRSVHAHGTPVYPFAFFRNIREVLGDDCEISFCTDAGGKKISTVMTFYYRDTVMPYFGGGLPEARRLKAFDYMYWEVMVRAADAGYRRFDYGRSKVGTGSYRFKKHWGFEPTELPYEYFLVRSKTVPNVSPANPKYELFIRMWKKLPYPATRVLGPMLSRHLA